MRGFVRVQREVEPPPAAGALRVGPVDDAAEREASATGDRVVSWLKARAGGPDGQPSLRSDGSGALRRNATATAAQAEVGPAGGRVPADLAAHLRRSGGGGRPLDDATRAMFEPAFGALFGDVRVHADSPLAPRLGARAFTQGRDVHFAPGGYRPGTVEGARTLAHELTHVLQQTGTRRPTGEARADDAGPAIAQHSELVFRRDVGFEFESRDFFTKRRNDDGATLPVGPFADDPTAVAANEDPDLTRIDKGDKILTQDDINIEADDAGWDSDLEAVTVNFPETGDGRARLNTALKNLRKLIKAGDGLKRGYGVVTAKALDGAGGFTVAMPDALIAGLWNDAQTAPQVTFGVRLGNIGDIVRDLHDAPGETALETANRAPGRLHIRKANPLDATRPVNLAPATEGNTLVRAHGIARQTLAAFEFDNPLAPAGGQALEGFLTVVFAYTEAMPYKRAFLKSHTPFMAKTDMLTTWGTLPEDVQTYYGTTTRGVTGLEQLIASAPDYAARMNRPFFDIIAVQEFDEINRYRRNGTARSRQWFHQLTLRQWMRSIALPNNRGWFQRIGDRIEGVHPGRDLLTNQHFPKKPALQTLEGYGALGATTDTDLLPAHDRLPVFELRSVTKLMTYAQTRTWALEVFDYICSLNANPGGGHALM